MKVKVRITKRDIKEGIQGEMLSCPIALCLRRKTKTRFRVGKHEITTLIGAKVTLLPPIAQRFVHKFDRSETKKVKPISFVIEIPDKFIKK